MTLVAERLYLVPHSNTRAQMKTLWGSFSQVYREVLFPWGDNVGWPDDHRPAILVDSQSLVKSSNDQELAGPDLNLYHDPMA